ncbi:MAG: F0F1 ATP synthase subunit B [Bacteroidales bacterium]
MDFLTPHLGTAFWALVIFLVSFAILKKYAWKPILEALRHREHAINMSLQSAKHAREEHEKLMNDNEKIITATLKQKEKILAEANATKAEIIERSRVEAKTEAEKIIEQARRQISHERELAENEIKEQLLNLAITVSEKAVTTELNNAEFNSALITELTKEADIAISKSV